VVKVVFKTMRCKKCGAAWKLPLSRAEVDAIIEAHKQRCDGAPEERGLLP
jgi:phage FluMu protein Com